MRMDKSNQQEGLWTAKRVADFLGIHPQTVYAKSRTGEVPSIRIGRGLRFRPEDIRAYLAGRERGTSAEEPCQASSTGDPVLDAGLHELKKPKPDSD